MVFTLATIDTAEGPRAAMVLNGMVIEIARLTGRRSDETVLGLFSDLPAALGRLDALAQAQPTGTPMKEVRLLSPIPLPPAIYCAGSNYADHAAEMAKANGREPPKDPHELGQRSWHFIKSSRSVAGPGETISVPSHTKKLDWEAELAVVIGKAARNVSEADALDYVGGYMIGNDLSARDLSRRAGLPENSSFKNDWLAHKSFDGACPLGPVITLGRDVVDPHDLNMVLEVNGVVKQDSNTSRMIFDIREQIADLSARLTLSPGDIILTGTPAGVGNGRGEFLKAGDEVRIRIEGLGELVNRFE